MARCYWFRCRLRPEEVITLLGGTSSVGCFTAKFSAEFDRVAALHALQLLLDRHVLIILFVWILPPLEVDPVRKDGVGIKVKVDGVVAVVVVAFDETSTNLRDEVRCPLSGCTQPPLLQDSELLVRKTWLVARRDKSVLRRRRFE